MPTLCPAWAMPVTWPLEKNYNMFRSHQLEFEKTGSLNAIVLHYLQQKENLKPFYGAFPDAAGIASTLLTDPYKSFDRDTLVKTLEGQHLRVSNGHPSSLDNIRALASQTAYTITTGHQLCLFTGPLYFIYKIISVIKLSQQLSQQHQGLQFVPVYWMASEDHDFEEINHATLFGKTIQWDSTQKGAVGAFSLETITPVLEQMREIAGTAPHAKELMQLFEDAYHHSNLADATRYLVNGLFGRFGLVVVDGQDKAWKTQCVPLMKRDIFEQGLYPSVKQSIDALQQSGYEAQVNPREINFFFLDKGMRARLEKDGDSFKVVGENLTFTKSQIEHLMQDEPERFSPNVVVRPLYQQLILPNLAYIGGPGEIAYWLEFKRMFDLEGVFFPLLIPRDFMTQVDKGLANKMEKLGFDAAAFFNSDTDLIQAFQLKHNKVFEAETLKSEVREIYTKLNESIVQIDKSLGGSVSAELQKVLSGMDVLVAKTNKTLKQQSETELSQIKNIKQKLFPNGVPQERVENFTPYYLKHGPAWLDALLAEANPLMFSQKILLEL
jgi:bacillithiol biosynthesis cysteine-adding enzyme BshC